MKEKERYVIRYDLDYILCLIDTEENKGVGDYIRVVSLLNQQDKRIKELEEALKNEEQLHDLCIEDNQKDKDFLRKQIKYESDARNRFMKENQKLKQQLHDLPKKLVEEIKNVTTEIEFRDCRWLGKQAVYDKLDTILKKFGGE